MKKITINQMPSLIGEEVKLGAWIANKRSSGKIAFYNYVMEQVLFKVSL